MRAKRDEIFSDLCRLLQPFNVKNVPLTASTDISGDLNIDSVSVMDFVMEVEDHFQISIPLNVLSETRTMADLTKVVESRLKQDHAT
jgi:acyl carrier protein